MELTTDGLDAISGFGPARFATPTHQEALCHKRVYTEPTFDLDLEFEKEAAKQHGCESVTDKRIRLSGDATAWVTH